LQRELRYNKLTGGIPSSFIKLKRLTRLFLTSNDLSGPIPAFLENLDELTHLYLDINGFTGPIPPFLGNLKKLKRLVLQYNQLQGTIPSSLGSLTNLEWLWLAKNQLHGRIPDTLGNLASLTSLQLYKNELSGPIPHTLRKLSRLDTLFLSGNKLSGIIPESLGKLTNLTRLTMHDNELTGVPSSLNHLKKCRYIVLIPNPMSLIPYDIKVKNPVSTMSAQNLTDFLIVSKKQRRQSSSNVATLTTEQLLQMCPLSNVVKKQDILAGCIAGITYFCQGKTDLTQCQRYYDTVFSHSIFAPIGANCPAWKYGPNSWQCNNAVNAFNVKLEYTTVNMVFAKFFAEKLFANKDLAPCSSNCQW